MAAPKPAAPAQQPMLPTAVFSTEQGRLPRRKLVPPFPPVIVRGDRAEGVRQCAHYWRQKCPEAYSQVFPQNTIEDLWDDYDIHIDSPAFLRDVIAFISHENLARVHQFAAEWSNNNFHRLHIAGGDIGYDPSHPLDCVGNVFEEQEIQAYGRAFLWHVLCLMRMGFATVSAQQAKDKAKAKAEGLTSGQDPQHAAASKAPLQTAQRAAFVKHPGQIKQPVINVHKPKVHMEQPGIQPQQAGATPQRPQVQGFKTSTKDNESVGKGPPASLPAAQPLTTSAESGSAAVPADISPPITLPKREQSSATESLAVPVHHTNVGERRTVSDELARGKYLNAGMDRRQIRTASATPTINHISQFGHVAVPTIPNGPDMRGTRRASGSYQHNPRLPPMSYGPGPFNDMARPAMPPASSVLLPPGIVQFGQSPQAPMHPPMAPTINQPPSYMYPPGGLGPPNVPAMNAAPGGYFSPPQGMAVPHGMAPYVGGEMAQFQPNNPPGIPGQYVQDRRSQFSDQSRQQTLYDPNSGTNRSFSDFKIRGNGRGRGSFSRGNFRNGANERMAFERGSHASHSHRQENMVPNAPPTGNTVQFSREGNANTEPFPAFDSHIANPEHTQAHGPPHAGFIDHDAGCDEDWIGPRNNTVKSLFVYGLADGMNEHGFKNFIQNAAHVRVASVRTKGRGTASVMFHNTGDARTVLQNLQGVNYGNRVIHFAVARMYLPRAPSMPFNGNDFGNARTVSGGPPERSSMSSGRRVSMGQQAATRHYSGGQGTIPVVEGADQTTYSPQDARSGLQRPTGGDVPVARGSPEARKPTKRPGSSTASTTASIDPAAGVAAPANEADAKGGYVIGTEQKSQASGAGKSSRKKKKNNQKVTLAGSSEPLSAPSTATSTSAPASASTTKEKHATTGPGKDAASHVKDLGGSRSKAAAAKQKSNGAPAKSEVKKTKTGQKTAPARPSNLADPAGAATTGTQGPVKTSEYAVGHEQELVDSAVSAASKPAPTIQLTQTTRVGSPSLSTVPKTNPYVPETTTEVEDKTEKTSTVQVQIGSLKQNTSSPTVSNNSTKSPVAVVTSEAPISSASVSEARKSTTKVETSAPSEPELTKTPSTAVPKTPVPTGEASGQTTSVKETTVKPLAQQADKSQKVVGSHPTPRPALSKQAKPVKEQKKAGPSAKPAIGDEPTKEASKKLPTPSKDKVSSTQPDASNASLAQGKPAPVVPDGKDKKGKTAVPIIPKPASQTGTARVPSVASTPSKEPKDVPASPNAELPSGPHPSKASVEAAPDTVPASSVQDTVDDGPVSDDEQKQDTSFHSAKETQSDGEREGETSAAVASSSVASTQEKSLVKKPGPSQTESLSSFAKEKQLEKQRRREQKAARKKKPEKPAKSTKSSKGKTKTQPVPEQGPSDAPVVDTTANASQRSTEVAKLDDDTLDRSTAAQEEAASDGGKTNATGLDTNGSNHGSSEQVKGPPANQDASSYETASTTVDLTQAPRPASVPPLEQSDVVKSIEEQEREKKAAVKRAKVADLTLKVGQPPSQDPAEGGSSGNKEQQEGKGKAKMVDNAEANVKPENEAAKDTCVQSSTGKPPSEASDDTLVGDTLPLSPSPTADAFHTPMQTPSFPPPTPDLPVQSKKNKKKKKKSKTGSATGSNIVGEAASDAARTGEGAGQTSGGGSGNAPEPYESPDAGQGATVTAEPGPEDAQDAVGVEQSEEAAAGNDADQKPASPSSGPNPEGAAEVGTNENNANNGAFEEQIKQLLNIKSEGKSSVSVYDQEPDAEKEVARAAMRARTLQAQGLFEDDDPELQQGLDDWAAIQYNPYVHGPQPKPETPHAEVATSIRQNMDRSSSRMP